MTIKIVTDSTCDLPENVIQDLGITVVPLDINLFDKGYLDGLEITGMSSIQIYQIIRSTLQPVTLQKR